MEKNVGDSVATVGLSANRITHNPRPHYELLYKKAAGAGGKNPCCDEHNKMYVQDRTPITRRPLG